MASDEIARALRLDGNTIEQLSRTIAENPRATIEPTGGSSDAPGRRAIEGLGAERAKQGIAAGLSIEQTIGEGGMGIVCMATQRSLGRKVAVKTLRPDARTERATLHLLREAWVTGSLEHPNIVPVYDLGLDDDGSPIIVLKKIDGAPWASVIANPEEANKRFGAQDLLEHNLRILVQLCNAVALAHARGILHRDLKPENVMIGSFGEVYLVDWGIAVSLSDDPTGRLPTAKGASHELAGTPCYMAPEMLGKGELTERTDVYLLGAVLHEILSGAPPHQGTFSQILASIIRSEPTYEADVPAELAAIASKAMSRDPADRHASADELRQRLEWYLRHRGSLALSNEASKSLARMNALVASGAERDDVYRLFAEARFGFRQAIAASEDNHAARAGLRESIEAMVAFELERGTPEAAAAALAELERPPESLATRVAAARDKERRERERLARLGAEFDVTTGRRTRLFVSLLLGVLWAAAPQLGRIAQAQQLGNPLKSMWVSTGILIVLGFLIGRWRKEALGKTAINRRMRAAVQLTLGVQLMLEVGCWILDVPVVAASVLHFVVWTAAVALSAVMVEPRMWPTAAVYAIGFFASCAWPSMRWNIMTASHLAMIANFLWAWGSLAEDNPRAVHAYMQERRNQSSRRPPPNTRSP